MFNSKPRCEWEAIQTNKRSCAGFSLSLLPRGKRENPRDEVEEERARSRASDFNLVSRVSLLPKWLDTLGTKLCWFLSWQDWPVFLLLSCFLLLRLSRVHVIWQLSRDLTFDRPSRPPVKCWLDMKLHTYPGAYALHKNLITVLTGRLGWLKVSFRVMPIKRVLMNV